MKRILITAVIAAAAASAWGASLPYYSDMGIKSLGTIDPEWTIINETAGTKTWVYDNTDDNFSKVTEASAGIKYQYDYSNPADDWAVSPALALQPGTEYKVSFWMKTSSNEEDITLYLTTSTDPTAMRASTVLHDFVSFKDSSWKKYVYTFTVSEGGDYHAAFFIHSPKNRYNVFLRGFTLSENLSIPARPTELTATAGADEALTVDLAWTLPTKDTDGNDLAAAIDNVLVSRDGELIATLAGTAVSFTDDESYGLDSGFHTYAVKVSCNGQTSAEASVKTSYVGPVKPFAIPFEDSLENDDLWNLWTVVDVAGDVTGSSPAKNAWTRWMNTSLTGNILVYAHTGSAAEDDWVFTPALNFNGTGTYKVAFDACMYSYDGSNCLLDVVLAASPVASDSHSIISTYETFRKSTYPAQGGERVEAEFNVAEAGAYYIGFHEHYEGTEVHQVRLDNIAVTPVNIVVTGVEETVADSYRFDGRTLRFADEARTLMVTPSGIVVADKVCDSLDMTGLADGVYIVRHGSMSLKIRL